MIAVYGHKFNICEQFVNNFCLLLTISHFWSNILKCKSD